MNQGNKLADCADDWMTRDVETLTTTHTAQDAAKLMSEKEIGSIVIKTRPKKTLFGNSEGILIGIVTDTDIVRKVVAKNIDPEKIKIDKIMSFPVRTVPYNYPCIEMCRMLIENKIKRMPVIKNGVLAGIITSTDVMFAMVKLGRFYDLGKFVSEFSTKKVNDNKDKDIFKVKKWMNTSVLTIPKQTNLLSAARIMDEKKLGCLPVLAGSGYVVGIITDTDIVRKIAATSLDPSTAIVDDLMTKKVIMGNPEQTVMEVADLMVQKKLRRMPIVNDQDLLVGIISITDIINVLLQLNNVSRAQKLIKILYKGTADVFGR